MKKTVSIRKELHAYDLAVPEQFHHDFFDSIGSINLGFPMSKLTLCRIRPPLFGEEQSPDGSAELREATLELTMPTITLVDMANSILTTFNSIGREKASDLMDAARDRLLALMSSDTPSQD